MEKNTMEQMCKEIDEVLQKYNYLYAKEIKIVSLGKNPITNNEELSEILYKRFI